MPAAMRSACSAMALASRLGVGHQRARRCQREGSAGADADHAVVRLDDVAGARDDERHVRVGHHQERLQAPQRAVGAPLLRQLHRRPRQVAAVFLQLRLEALEEREGVRRRAGEAGHHAAVVQLAHLARGGLHHGLADGDLAVPRDGDGAAMAHRHHGGGAEHRHSLAHGAPLTRPPSRRTHQMARGCAASYTFIRCSGLTWV